MVLLSKGSSGVAKVIASVALFSISLGASAKEIHFKNSNVLVTKSAMSSQENVSYQIIQFKGNVTSKLRKQVEALGAIYKSYLPEDSILVKADASTIQKIKKTLEKEIEQIVPFVSQFKVDSEIRPSVFNNNHSAVFVIRTLGEEETEAVRRELNNFISVVEYKHSERTIYFSAKFTDLNKISEIQGVEWVQLMPEMQSMIVDFGIQEKISNPYSLESEENQSAGDYSDLTGLESGTEIMNFQPAYDNGYTGEGQIVTMADTGLDSGDVNNIHPDLTNVSHGYAVGLFSDSWKDPQGHGTHVAGSVVSTGSSSDGLLAGGAHGAGMIAQGMWSPIMNNLMVPPQLSDLFEPAYNDGSRIHTNSWGSPRNLGVYDNMSAQVDDYMWKNQDFLILFAAGNSGVDLDANGVIDEGSVSSPGTAKNALTVGASENEVFEGGIQRPVGKLRKENWPASPIAEDMLSNDRNGIAAFSSRGPTRDGRIKPEVVAPGTNILSTRSSVKDASVLWGAYNDNYVYAGGTSMATPLTAGAAAVVRQYTVDQLKSEPSAALIKAMLMHSAVDLFPGQFGFGDTQELPTERPNVHEGYGRVNVGAATSLFQQETSKIIDHKGISEDEEFSVTVEVANDGKLTATLVWTDAPANTSASKTLVNDLDLELRQNGELIASLGDRVNNNEIIEQDLTAGRYEVVVKAHRIIDGNDGRQSFALVVTK